nr:MAG TPA: hypothetical protein [Herelleviridae sp.]
MWLRRKPNHFKDLKRYDETKIPNFVFNLCV